MTEVYASKGYWSRSLQLAHSVRLSDENNIPAISGIDTEAGLATTQNNCSLYFRLLEKFRTGQADFEAMFLNAQNEKDSEYSEHIVKTDVERLDDTDEIEDIAKTDVVEDKFDDIEDAIEDDSESKDKESNKK